MSGFLRRLSVVLLVIAACFAGVRIYAAGSSSSSYYYTLNDDGAKVAAVPHSWAIGTVTQLSSLPYKPGYGFAGYYTGSGCSGTQIIDYQGNVLISLDASTTLYACWRALNPIWNTPLVVLSDNGGSGGAFASSCGTDFWTNSLHNEYVSYGHRGDWAYIDMPRGDYWWASPCTMTYSTVTTMASLPTRSGYTFNGYYTGQNGTGTQVVYANGNLVDADTLRNVLSSSVPTTIYAYWTVDYSGHYRITLNDAGGSGSQVSSMGTDYNLYEAYGECYESGTGINLSTGAPLNAVCIASIYATPTKTGYNFGGYYTGQNGSGVPIINSSGTIVGSNTQFTAPATIYAKWTPKVLTVTLNHNSPSNSPSPSTVYLKYATGWYSNSGATTTISSMSTVPTKTNYTFAGYWTTNASSGGVRIIDADGNFETTSAALQAFSANGTAYARWVSNSSNPTPVWVTVTLNDQSATTNSQPTVLYRNTNTAVSGCSGYKATQSCSAATVTSITPPTKTNYTYGGHWTSTGGSGNQWTNANGTILYNVTANTTVYAKWTADTGTVRTITLNKNGGSADLVIYEKYNVGWFSDSAGSYQITSSIFNPTSSGGAGLTKPTYSGYGFAGYFTATSGGNQIIDGDGNIVGQPEYNANTTLYAQWYKNTKVILDPNGGTQCSVRTVTATYGASMPELTCAPTYDGYIFVGYFDDPSGGTQYYTDELQSARNWDKTGSSAILYAHWEAVPTYNVVYYCDKTDVENGTPSYTDTGIYFGQDYMFKTRAAVGCSTLSGKKFLGWTDDEHGSSILYQPGQVATYPYHSDANLAAYNMDIGTVTLDHDSPDNTPSPSTVYYVPSDAWYTDSNATNEISTMATVPVKYGYDFLGYYTASSGGTKIIDENGEFINHNYAPDTLNFTLYARYSAKNYPFTLNDASATTASSPNPVTYKVGVGWANTSGTTITSVTTPTKTGNSFAGFWTGPNGTGTKIINADGTFVTMTSGILQEFDENNVDTLYAKWNPKYTVTFSCENQAGNGSGTPNPATVYVADGETLTFPALTNCSWGNAGMSPYMWGVVSGNTFTDTHDAGDTITWDSSWGDRTYNVWYAPNYFDYEYSCGTGSGTPPASGNTYYHNGGWTTAVNTCTAPANKHFVGWLEPVSGVTYAENTTPTGGGWIWPYNVTAAAGGAFVAQYADDTYTAHFTCENNTLSPYVFSGSAPADITDIAYQSTITLPSPNVCTNNYPDAGWIVSPATEWLYSCTDANGGALGGGSTAGAGSWTWPKQGNCTFRPNALYSTYHIYYYCDGTTNTVSLDQTVNYTNRDTVRPATAAAAGCSTPTGHHFKNWTASGTNVSGTMNPGTYGGSGDLWPYATTVNLRAQWEPDTYNLTWSCGEGSGTPSGAAFPTSINYGDTLTFPANTVCTAPTGHQFTSWVIDINATEYAPNSTFTWNLTDGSAITAHYEPVKVNITYSCGTDATGTPPAAQNNINYGSSVTLQALGNCAKTGHTATKWVVSNTSPADSYDFGATVNPWNYTENKTLTPNWSAQTYTITYELNGGTQASSGVPTSYTYGTTTTINGVPTLVGAEFAGWCDTESLTNCAMTKTISATTTGNKKFWAKWTCKTGYESNDIWLTAPTTVSDYSASGYTVYPAGTACIPGRYHINCNGNGGVACLEQVTSGNASNPQLHLGQFYGVRTAYGTGYDIVPGLATVLSTTQSDIESIINNNDGYYAFTRNPAYKTQVGVDVAYAASTYQGFIEEYANAYNSSAVFGRDHYTFNGLWSAAEGGTQYLAPNTNFGSLINTEEFSKSWLSDTTVYAQWIPDVYTITLNDTQNGGSGGDGVVYEKYETGFSKTNFGTTIQSVTKPTKTGYTFAGYWTSANGGTLKIPANGTLPAADTFGESTTLYAQFSANTYNVTYLCGTDATGTAPASATATYDANFTPASIGGCINPGRSFAGWLVSNTGNPSDTKQAGTAFQWKYTEDKTFTAQWTDNTYTITFHPGDGVTTTGTTEVKEWYSHAYRVQSGTGSMSWTAVTEITLPTKTGYTFAGYYNNPSFTGTPVMTDAALPVTTPTATYFTADADLYANWTANTYSIAYTLNGGAYGTNHPTSATFDSVFTVNNPTHEHATFSGWTVTGMNNGVTHYYGTSNPPTSTTTGTSITTPTKATYYKNLRSTSGTVTFTAVWDCDTGYTGTNCDAIDYTMQYVCSDGEQGWNFNGSAPVATNPVHYGQSVILAGDIYAQQNGCRKVWGTSSDADYCDDCFTFGGWRIDAESTAIPSAPVHMANSTVNPWGRTNTTDWCIISDTGNCLGFADDVFYVRPNYTPKQYNIEYMYATGPVSGASANMPASYTYTTVTTISNADQTAPAHAIFNGWCTNLNDASTCVAAGQPITIGNRNHGDMRYYANWTCDAGYTLTYDANNQPVCSADAMTCDPGYYLQGSSATCQPCLVGDYCEGGNFVHNGTDQGLKVCATEIATGWTSLGGTACTAKTSCYYPVTLNKNGFTGTIAAGAGTGCTVAATVTGTNPATLRLFYNTACTLPTFTTGLTQTGYTNATKWSEFNTIDATTVSTIPASTTAPTITTYYAQKPSCAANYYKNDTTTCSLCSGLGGGLYTKSAAGNKIDNTVCYSTVTAGTYIVNNTDSAVTECPGGSYCIGGNVYWPNVGNIDSCPDGYDLGDTGLSAQNQCQTSCPAGQCLPVAGGSCVDAGVGNWSAGGLVGYGSTLACNVCPTGLTTIGYGAGADEADDCGRVLHMGENRLYLRGAFRTTPSLRVKVGDNVFYGNMSTTLKNMSDGINKKLRLKYNGTTYSVYDDSVGE